MNLASTKIPRGIDDHQRKLESLTVAKGCPNMIWRVKAQSHFSLMVVMVSLDVYDVLRFLWNGCANLCLWWFMMFYGLWCFMHKNIFWIFVKRRPRIDQEFVICTFWKEQDPAYVELALSSASVADAWRKWEHDGILHRKTMGKP